LVFFDRPFHLSFSDVRLLPEVSRYPNRSKMERLACLQNVQSAEYDRAQLLRSRRPKIQIASVGVADLALYRDPKRAPLPHVARFGAAVRRRPRGIAVGANMSAFGT